MPGQFENQFDGLEDRLLRGGIAPRHVRRYLRELSDHLADLTQAQQEAGYRGEDAAARARAALGPDGELADAMLRQRDFRSVSARFPWLVFPLLPTLLTVIALALPVLLVIGITTAQKYLLGHDAPSPLWLQAFAHMLFAAMNFAAMPLAALLLTVIAWRQRLSPLWLLLSVAVLLVLVADIQSNFPNAAEIARHQQGSLSVGMGFSPGLEKLRKEMAATGYWAIIRHLLILLPPVLLLWHRRALAKFPATP